MIKISIPCILLAIETVVIVSLAGHLLRLNNNFTKFDQVNEVVLD